MRLEDAVDGAGQMLSLAYSWSRTAEGGYRWPADLETGQVNPRVLERWLRQSPIRLLDLAEGQAALRSLNGRLFISSSAHDEFDLFEPARRFSERLTALRIAHSFIVKDDGHFDAQPRLTELIRLVLEGFSSRS